MATVFNLDDNAFLRSRFQGHAASRVVTKTTQSLAQAGNLDGHIVVYNKIWSATNDQFLKHVDAAMKSTTNGLNATKDLVALFKGLPNTVACTTDINGVALPANLSGKVYRNPDYPAIELYDGVLMTGVAGSNAVGSGATARYESYEILNGTARVMDWVPPTAVSDGSYPVVPGYTGRVEVCKDASPTAASVWTDLENCGDVSGVWALDQANWEFVYMAGMVKFHPNCTPIGKSYKSIRFTGFKYIGSVLSDTLTELQTNVEENIGVNLAAVTKRVETLESNTADLPTMRTDIAARVLQTTYDANKTTTDAAIAALQSGKVDVATGKSLIADTEISKLADFPSFAEVQALIDAQADPGEVDAAIAAVIADYYNKSAIDTKVAEINAKLVSVFKYKGQVDNIAALPAEGVEVGHVYHVVNDVAAAEGVTPRTINSEYVWNGEKWEELGGIIDLSAYATIEYVDGVVAAEKTRAEAAEKANSDAIAAEAQTARAAEAANKAAVEAEVTRATGEEARIEGLVTAEAERAAAAEKANAEAIAAETERAEGEEERIEGLVTAEAARAAGEEERIEGLLEAEVTRATGVEEGLRTDLNAEIERAKAAEGSNKTAIETEAATARAAEQANANAISAETTAREEAVQGVVDDLAAEAQTARAAEQANANAIAAETERAEAEEARIVGLLEAEAATARAAEEANAAAITAEAATARAAEEANAAAIAAETEARTAAVKAVSDVLPTKANVVAVQYLTTGTVEAPEAVELVVDTWYIVKAPFVGTLPTAPADGTTIKVSTLVGGDMRRLIAGTGDTILGSANPCAIGITEDGLSLDTENYVFLYVAADKNWVVL